MGENSIAKTIQDLVSQGKLDEAIDFLKDNIENQSEVVQLSSRYHELNRKIRLNFISEAEVSIERNKITSAVLAIVEGCNGNNEKSNSFIDKHKNNQNQKTTSKITYTVVVTTIIAACAVLTLVFTISSKLGHKPINIAKPDQESQINTQIKDLKDNHNVKNEVTASHDQPKNPNTNTKILNEVIKYKGIPIENAYFVIENCKSCNSSVSNNKGEVQAEIPFSFYKRNNWLNFLIYSDDTMLYAKKMRFTNLDFNKY